MRQDPLNDTKAYTLIELTVVLVLIALIITLIVPRFRYAILSDNLKSITRRMVGMIKVLRNDAVRDQKAYVLHFDLDSNDYWVESDDMTAEERTRVHEKATPFPKGIEVIDVWYGGRGKKADGEATIRFNKNGYVQESVIHFGSEDGRKFTLVLSPFLGRVKVLEDYVDFEGS